jgi:opacity protein-like surface antigen
MFMDRIFNPAILVVLAVTLVASHLRAADSQPVLLENKAVDPFYVKVGGAALVEQKVNISQIGLVFQNGTTSPGPATQTTGVPHIGGGFDATFGYHMSPSLVLEFDTGAYWNDINNEPGPVSGPIFTNGTIIFPAGSAPMFLHLSQQQIPLMVSLVYHFNPDGRWIPYVGLGAGGLLDIVEFRSAVDGSTATDENFGFVGQVQAGCNYQITKHASVDLDYKFLFASDQHFQAFGEPAQLQGVCEHLFQLSFDWRF